MANPETRLHSAVVRFLRTVAPQCVTFHIANGGKRSPETARLMKALGVLPGVFDLCLLAPGARVFFLECKAGAGHLSESQREFQCELIRLGIPYAEVRSLEDVRTALAQWGVETREAIAA